MSKNTSSKGTSNEGTNSQPSSEKNLPQHLQKSKKNEVPQIPLKSAKIRRHKTIGGTPQERELDDSQRGRRERLKSFRHASSRDLLNVSGHNKSFPMNPMATPLQFHYNSFLSGHQSSGSTSSLRNSIRSNVFRSSGRSDMFRSSRVLSKNNAVNRGIDRSLSVSPTFGSWDVDEMGRSNRKGKFLRKNRMRNSSSHSSLSPDMIGSGKSSRNEGKSHAMRLLSKMNYFFDGEQDKDVDEIDSRSIALKSRSQLEDESDKHFKIIEDDLESGTAAVDSDPVTKSNTKEAQQRRRSTLTRQRKSRALQEQQILLQSHETTWQNAQLESEVQTSSTRSFSAVTVGIFIFYIIIFVLFMMREAEYSFERALLCAIITFLTVGYGIDVPETSANFLFLTVMTIFGIGIFHLLIIQLQSFYVVESKRIRIRRAEHYYDDSGDYSIRQNRTEDKSLPRRLWIWCLERAMNGQLIGVIAPFVFMVLPLTLVMREFGEFEVIYVLLK